MKTFFRIAAAAALFAAMTACDAFHSLTKSRLKTAQGSPYELIVVCPQQEWTGELGDTLRSILTAPVPYLNQTEPLFDVLRVTERGFSGMVADHRNILKIVEDPSLAATNIAVQYDVTAEPQIVLTLQGPDDKALTDYLSEHRESLVQVLEKAERDRAVKFAEACSEQRVEVRLGVFSVVHGVTVTVHMKHSLRQVLAERGDDVDEGRIQRRFAVHSEHELTVPTHPRYLRSNTLGRFDGHEIPGFGSLLAHTV